MREILSYYVHSEAPVTYMVMLVIFAVSAMALIKQSLYFKLFFHPYSIHNHREYHRLFTGAFVHNDVLHLLFNELVLYVSCANLESFLRKEYGAVGSIETVAVYLASFLVSVTISTVIHRNDYKFSSAGASACIIGCMMSFMIVAPNYVTFYLPLLGALKNKFAVFFYMVILIVYQKRKKNDAINHEQHFYGALGGISATLLLFPELLK